MRPALIVLAMAVGGLVLLPAALPGATTAALSCAALLALAGALYLATAGRVAAAPAQRLGGKAEAHRRRYLALSLVASGVLYAALALGTISTSSGSLWSCTTWPLCSASSEGAWLALTHRGLAAVATLLILALTMATRRTFADRAARQAAGWALGLMLVQNLIGMAQVILASTSASLPLAVTRGTHLALGAAAWSALVVLVTLGARLPWPEAAAVERSSSNAEPSKLKDYISLTKPGVITLLIFTTFAGMVITPAGMPGLALIAWTMLGGWLMAAGAHSVNCWADRDIDVNMGRTARRPIPSGRIPAWHALALGIALGVVAFAILAVFVNIAAALLSLAGYLFYVFVYTRWLKRSTPSNIVIGGAAGAFPPLVGWAAATGSLTLPSLLLFLIVFYWTPPHFWALALIREKDYARAGVPMLPVVAGEAETKRQILLYTIQMIALTVIPTPLGMFGIPYLLMAAGLAAWFMVHVVRLMRRGTTASAWGLYKFSLLYLFLLFGAMMIDRLAFA